jgi:hypothetical protein
VKTRRRLYNLWELIRVSSFKIYVVLRYSTRPQCCVHHFSSALYKLLYFVSPDLMKLIAEWLFSRSCYETIGRFTMFALTACLSRDYSHISDKGIAKTRRKDTTTDQQFLPAISILSPSEATEFAAGKRKRWKILLPISIVRPYNMRCKTNRVTTKWNFRVGGVQEWFRVSVLAVTCFRRP